MTDPLEAARLIATIRLKLALQARLEAQSVPVNTPYERELKNQVVLQGDELVTKMKKKFNDLNKAKEKKNPSQR